MTHGYEDLAFQAVTGWPERPNLHNRMVIDLRGKKIKKNLPKNLHKQKTSLTLQPKCIGICYE
jgi:hypothetical protein